MPCFPERIEASIVFAPVSSFPHLNISCPCPFFLPFLSLRKVCLCTFPRQILPLGSAILLLPFSARILSQFGLMYSIISCHPSTCKHIWVFLSCKQNKHNSHKERHINSAYYPLLSKWSPCVCASLLQLCLTLCDPKDCSPPGSSLHGILQVRILEWVAMPSTRGSSPPRDRTGISFVSCIAGGFFTSWVTREAPSKWSVIPQTFHHCPLLPCFLLHIPHIPISYFYFPTSTVLFLYNLLPGISHSISFVCWNLPESITHYLLHGLPWLPSSRCNPDLI